MHKEAIRAFKQAIRIKPDMALAHYNLAVVYEKSGMHKEAIEASKQAIRIKPGMALAHYNLGLAYLSVNDRGSALEQYKILKDLDTESANKLFSLIYK
jgi:tetratricopeptide (TPR) repeat protein